MKFDITIIIPTYNVQSYIHDTLTSIINQKFEGDIEVIIIDDCSSDNTLEVAKEFSLNTDTNIKILHQQKNMRQGTARNRGIREAQGKYVLFLDGDDFLDELALKNMFEKAEEFSCDFVICDWAYYYEDDGLVYVNHDDFMYRDLLKGNEVESLLKAETYFSVNKLYNKKFLVDNNIKYGEGYIYEDFEFYIQVAQYGNIVGVIQNPYYRVRVNEFSTTKTNTKSTFHIDSLLLAVENSLRKFEPRAKFSYYHFYKYIIKKSLSYLDTRAPKKYKRRTLIKILQLMNSKNDNFPVPKKVVPLYHFLFRRKYIKSKKVNKIFLVWWLYRKKKLNSFLLALKKAKRLILNSRIGIKIRRAQQKKKISNYNNSPVNPNTILFLGFDYRYIGNSKYYFEHLTKNNTNQYNIYYVTKNRDVPNKYRISPRSLKFYEKLAEAKVVFFESWVPLDFIKREDSVWIQLWHGTPFKKMFFDSHEYYISNFNKNHKRNKQKDIRRWDYLLSDSEGGREKLASAFAYDKSNILNYGYPRVQWLKENKNNQGLKQIIREQLIIPQDKKVIVYAPTWRDYNYKSSEVDFSYLLDIQRLEENLKDEYVIIYKAHSMDVNHHYNKNVIIPSDDIETQRLLLIADFVISDFSSIIFDAMAVDIPFYLFVNDFNKYSQARGVYEDINKKLEPFYVENELDLASKITGTTNFVYPTKYFEILKDEFSNPNKQNSNRLLDNKINQLTKKRDG